jgi:hypothetical protein
MMERKERARRRAASAKQSGGLPRTHLRIVGYSMWHGHLAHVWILP